MVSASQSRGLEADPYSIVRDLASSVQGRKSRWPRGN